MRKHSTRLSQAHDEDDEGQEHTAARDYPELGTILSDRPDPGSVITVIGSRHQAEAYDAEHDARNGDYNGGEGDLGMYWAEPGEQQWARENLGPQEEAPPPVYAPDMMPPAMARLMAMEEAQEFFGLRHHATTINGTQVDDAGDAPQHGTVPRAEDPDSYDDASHEGEGDGKWDDPLPWGSKKDENAATVGMYPEGVSSGNGPGLPIGAFTASISDDDYAELRQHMLEDHGYEGSRIPNDFWRVALPHRHSVDHFEGNADHYHPEDYEFDPDWEDHGGHGGYHEFTGSRTAHLDEEWNTYRPDLTHVHGQMVTGPQLASHMREYHGFDFDPRRFSSGQMRAAHTMHHAQDFDHPGEADLRWDPAWDDEPEEREPAHWSTPVTPDYDEDDPIPGSATYYGHGGHIDPVFGSLHEARVPWTGQERGTLHTWQESPQSSTWGDFVNSADFPLLGPGEHVHHVEPEAGLLPVTATSDAQWEAHLRHGHGWDDARIERARSEGGFRNIHEAMHRFGLPNHRHVGGPEDERDAARDQSVTNMFGPAFPKRTPQQMPLARPELGGSGRPDPETSLLSSLEARPPVHPDEYYQTDPARFRRMMSSLSAREALIRELEEDYPPDALDWIRTARVSGPHLVPLAGIDWSDRHTWTSYKQPRKCAKFTEHLAQKSADGEHLKPALVIAAGSKQPFIGDGHHRSLVQLLAAARGEGEPGVWAYTAKVDDDEGPWDTMHDKQLRATSKDSTKRTTGPDAPPGEVEAFQGDVDDAISSLGLEGEHDDEANSLDSDAGKNGPEIKSPQVKGRGKKAVNPDTWPAAGADVTETGRAMTQGSGDGKVKRGAPAPAAFSPSDGGSGGGGDQPDDDDTPFSKDAALAMFTAAAGSPSFRFHFTAAWHDVVAKAKRIRAEGHVRIVHASAGMVIGEVRGDHDTYESGIQRPVGKRQSIAHWACGCPWASFHQDKSMGTRYAGRPCSHVMALQFEAQSRGMFGRQFNSDAELPSWSPPTVVVKSMPPYEGDPHAGQWREQWRAPVARRRARYEGGPEEIYGDPYPDDEDGAPGVPARAAARHGSLGAPSERATAALLRAGEDPGTVGALRLLAGLRATADQANAPWGSQNVSQHPTQKPYGATSPPNLDMDPGSYGPLSAPDPENWGGIQDDSAYQMPLTNSTAAHQVLVPGSTQPQPGDLRWPSTEGWAPEDQGTFSYTDRSNTAGPSTAMTPRDPNGIRMEEALASGTPYPFRDTVPQLDGALAELRDHPEPALPSTTGEDPQEEGEGLREAAGIDGTMGDAQDVPHQYTAASGPHGYCSLCGGSEGARAHTAAADGTIGGGSTGTGMGQGAADDTASLGEFGASMGDLARETWPQAQQPSQAGQNPGMGSFDEYLTPDDQSIQTIGNQQWSGGGADSDEVAVEPGQSQGSIGDIVASFQRSAAARGYDSQGPVRQDGDIAAAARSYLAKTADVLPQAEADELIREGAGSRARNLDLLRLEGTHYEDEEAEAGKQGVSMDDFDDDVIFA